MEVIGDKKLFGYQILQNVCFFVQQKTETYIQKVLNNMRVSKCRISFWVNYPFKLICNGIKVYLKKDKNVPFMFHRRKNFMQFRNDMRLNKLWNIFWGGWAIPLMWDKANLRISVAEWFNADQNSDIVSGSQLVLTFLHLSVVCKKVHKVQKKYFLRILFRHAL